MIENTRSLQIEMVQNRAIFRLSGPLDMMWIPELEQKVDQVLKENPSHLLFNLSDVHYINSDGISTLIKIRDKIHQQRGRFGLIALSEEVTDLLQLLMLDHLFSLYKTEADAVKTHAQKPHPDL